MPEVSPEPAESSADIGSDSASLREAADQRVADRAEPEPGIDEISYRDQHGKPTDKHLTLKADRAARDLADYRGRQRLAEEREQADLVRAQADALRRQNATNAQPPQYSAEQRQAQATALSQQAAYTTTAAQDGYTAVDQQSAAVARDPAFKQHVQTTTAALIQRANEIHDQIATAQVLGQSWTELGQELEQIRPVYEQYCQIERARGLIEQGVHPEIATAVSSHRTLNWMKEAVDGYETAYRESVARHEASCGELIDALESVVLWAFPELQHARAAGGVNAVIDLVGRHNPKRATDIQAGYRVFEQAAEKGLQARQRGEQQKREEFQVWAHDQDVRFWSEFPEYKSPQVRAHVGAECFKMLQEDGLSQQEIDYLVNNDRLMRSTVGQKVLLRATKYWNAQKNISVKKQARPSPEPTHVLRPGSGADRIDADRSPKLPESMDWRQGARALIERRAKRR